LIAKFLIGIGTLKGGEREKERERESAKCPDLAIVASGEGRRG
jgi:hypothetical protein